jgi:hypothetical protein
MKKIQKRLMKMNEKKGWSGMLGSVDCMYWRWKNFPKAWPRQYCGKNHDPNIVLKVVSSMTCGFGNVFYGLSGSLNDNNVFHRSHLFARLVSGGVPACRYKVNAAMAMTA